MARVVVDVMLKPEILDPQGEAVTNALPRLGVTGVSSVRIGKRIEIDFAGEADLDAARQIADQLLANPVIEDFALHLTGDGEAAEGARPAEAGEPRVAGPGGSETVARVPGGSETAGAGGSETAGAAGAAT